MIKPEKDVSIIIVNYNTKELTDTCLKSIIQNTEGIDYEIIVSDNGSKDGSIEYIKENFPGVILLENGENLGFGAANNRAVHFAKGKYIFYLNSDTILISNAVKALFDFWEQNKDRQLGVVGAQLVDENMNIIHSWGKYPTPKRVLVSLLHMYLLPSMRRRNSDQEKEIICKELIIDGYITGADMFLLNNEDAFFDEIFFMYAEEADLQYNNFYLKEKECVLLPEIKIIHLEGGSDKSESRDSYDFGKKSTIYIWLSYVKYLKKNYPQEKILRWIIKSFLLKIWNSKKYFKQTRAYTCELKNL